MILKILLILMVAELSGSNKFCNPNLCEDGSEHLLCKDDGKYNYYSCPKRATKLVKMTKHYIDLILQSHNGFRNMVALGKVGHMPMAARMPVLKWDKDLAKVSEVSVRRCEMEPLKCATTVNYPSTGQSEALEQYYCKMSTSLIIHDHINYWLAHSDLTTAKDLINPDYSDKNVSYFLQAVRDRSNRIGCAAIRYIIPNLVHLLFRCVYSCGISMCSEENPVYEVAKEKPGELCQTGSSSDFNGLCSEKEPIKKCSKKDPIEKPDDEEVNNEESKVYVTAHPPILFGG